MPETWQRYLWGKTNPQAKPGEADFHHVLCHLVDVAVVAEAVLRHPGAGHWVERLARVLGMEPGALRSRLPYLIGLHDLGKASPGFQAKWAEGVERLRAAGAPWPPAPMAEHRHDRELGCILTDLLPELRLFTVEGVRERRFFLRITAGLAAHHGAFFRPGEVEPDRAEVWVEADLNWQEGWLAARRWLAGELRRLLGTPAEPAPCRPGNLSAVAMLLNGLTILCDWVGSDSRVFPASGFPEDLEAYVDGARAAAEAAVNERRLFSFLRLDAEPTFASLFPKRTSVRSIQRAVDREALPVLPRQFLAIVEGPMGEGKTEAAEVLALRLAWAGGCQGFYFALPTIATSNQMYGRVRELLATVNPHNEQVLLALVNGMAEFHPDVEAALRRGPAAPTHGEEQRVAFDSWYLPRKRSLLTAYGVGTIDQALLAGLATRHVGLRLLGLAGKCVIIDEVHAYDLYMSTILDRLLEWLKELGASVILLSATLPAERRAELVRAFAGENAELPSSGETSGAEAPYPLVTLAEPGGAVRALPCGAAARSMSVRLERRTDGEATREDTARWLLEELKGGGRAVWICNTVAEAQTVYRVLARERKKLPEVARPDLLLFHARFLMKDRRDIEERVLGRFGPQKEETPGAERPVILVATQVVEQSLDLDFDLMVSQLAPIDLLLQRIGRLWRHADRTERGAFAEPRLVLLVPDRDGDGRPRFGTTGIVYSPHILLRTLAALETLRTPSVIQLPGEIRSLIEAVYDFRREVSAEALVAAGLVREWLEETASRDDDERSRLQSEARKRLLGWPRPAGDFYVAGNEEVAMGEVEAEEVEHLAMQTRLGRPTVRALLLAPDDPLFSLVQGDRPLTRDEVKEVLERTVSLSYGALVSWVCTQALPNGGSRLTPPRLAEVNALRRVVLLPLTDHRFSWPPDDPMRWLRLDKDLGVVFDRDEDAE